MKIACFISIGIGTLRLIHLDPPVGIRTILKQIKRLMVQSCKTFYKEQLDEYRDQETFANQQ